MIKRPFSKKLYETYDNAAKEKLISFLELNGHTILNDKEDYNADVVSEKDGLTYYNEAEVKVAWTNDWPSHWAEIRIPERKKRLVKMYAEQNGVLNFYVFRKDMKQAWRIKDTCLTEESLAEAKGKYIRKGEKFFHIPYTNAELVTL
jgi:hypothetical protein|tara:strand:+ start:238 stop:678 length:441 start_codon:yes stop_codon:yes gene_type:complete